MRPASSRTLVFPTCVGVFPSSFAWEMIKYCLPHVRGGVSVEILMAKPDDTSSPRAWGCFSLKRGKRPIRLVFPTCVGVFPGDTYFVFALRRLPHVRGGVSAAGRAGQRTKSSSPRAWGCFSIPDATGGLSRESSPRAWGCFELCGKGRKASCVFPTCVGVFLRRTAGSEAAGGLPHVRGGVS